MEPKSETNATDRVLLCFLVISLAVNVFQAYAIRERATLLRNYSKELQENRSIDSAGMDELSASDAPRRGEVLAPVTMVIFTDFQCPYCQKFAATVKEIQAQMTQLRVVVRHFPLPIHPYARKEAELSSCIFKQNPDAFWIAYDTLYSGNEIKKDMTENVMQAISSRRDVDIALLHSCIQEHKESNQVDHDVYLAKKVWGKFYPPTVFVNGVRVNGEMRSADNLVALIGIKSLGKSGIK